jgi:hypothetical protein
VVDLIMDPATSELSLLFVAGASKFLNFVGVADLPFWVCEHCTSHSAHVHERTCSACGYARPRDSGAVKKVRGGLLQECDLCMPDTVLVRPQGKLLKLEYCTECKFRLAPADQRFCEHCFSEMVSRQRQ